MSKIKTYKLFESYDDVKSIIKDVMDDIEDDFGFDCIYHSGFGWSYPCDLALVVPLQGNVIHDTERYWIEKAIPSKSIGLEKIKQKYNLIYQRLNDNTYIKNQGVEIVGMMIYFRGNFTTFSDKVFLSWEDFVEDLNYGKYVRVVKKIPNLEEIDNLVLLFKSHE